MRNSKLKLKKVESSDIPIRGKWQTEVKRLTKEFQSIQDSVMEVIGFSNPKELMAIYNSFKNYYKRNPQLNQDIKKEGNRLFLIKLS